MMIPYENRMVIPRTFLFGQTRLTFRYILVTANSSNFAYESDMTVSSLFGIVTTDNHHVDTNVVLNKKRRSVSLFLVIYMQFTQIIATR